MPLKTFCWSQKLWKSSLEKLIRGLFFTLCAPRSLSFVTCTGCFSFLLLGAMHFIMDIKGWWGGQPFIYPGELQRHWQWRRTEAITRIRNHKQNVFQLSMDFLSIYCLRCDLQGWTPYLCMWAMPSWVPIFPSAGRCVSSRVTGSTCSRACGAHLSGSLSHTCCTGRDSSSKSDCLTDSTLYMPCLVLLSGIYVRPREMYALCCRITLYSENVSNL